MAKQRLVVDVPDGEALVAGVVVRIREDATFTVQEYRQSENLSGSEMARVLRELATTLELEAQLDDD